MTRRFWLLVWTIYALLLLGLATLNGGAIVLAIPLVVYLAAAAYYAPRPAEWRIQRTLPNEVVAAGQPVPVRLDVAYQGEPVEEAYMEDVLPDGLKLLEGQPLRRLSLPAQGESTCEYTVQMERGSHVFSGVRLVWREHFGLFEIKQFKQDTAEIETLPEVYRLRRLAIRPRQTRGFTGPIPARQGGSGMTFWGVRTYRAGDPRRRINWKVSSRHPQGGLFTNEYELRRVADVGIILDARLQTNLMAGQSSLFEHAVQATAALADAFLADGHRVSLLTYGFGVKRVFPGYGKIQRERILRTLAHTEPGSNYALENFRYLPTRLFPARSQLVIVSPLTWRDFPAFANLCRDGYQLLIVSPDVVDFEFRRIDKSLIGVERAARLARLERTLLLRRLTYLGAQVVNWQVDQPFEQVIHAALARQQVFRRNIVVALP